MFIVGMGRLVEVAPRKPQRGAMSVACSKQRRTQWHAGTVLIFGVAPDGARVRLLRMNYRHSAPTALRGVIHGDS